MMGIEEPPVEAACNILSQLFLTVSALAVKHKAMPHSQLRQPTLPDVVDLRHEVSRLIDQTGDSSSLEASHTRVLSSFQRSMTPVRTVCRQQQRLNKHSSICDS